MTDLARETIDAFVAEHDFTPTVECTGRAHGHETPRAIWYSRTTCCRAVEPVCAICVGRLRAAAKAADVWVCGHCHHPTVDPQWWDVDIVELHRIKGAS